MNLFALNTLSIKYDYLITDSRYDMIGIKALPIRKKNVKENDAFSRA